MAVTPNPFLTNRAIICLLTRGTGGGGTWVFLGGYVPQGTPNWHPVRSKKNFPKIDTPF